MILKIIPVPKPRMVKSDAWRKRECVIRYWKYKADLESLTRNVGYRIDGSLCNVVFVLPMAKSWSKKKKAEHEGKPHQNKPDLDNLIKAFQDCLCKEDSYIHTIDNVKKVWGYEGAIILDL